MLWFLCCIELIKACIGRCQIARYAAIVCCFENVRIFIKLRLYWKVRITNNGEVKQLHNSLTNSCVPLSLRKYQVVAYWKPNVWKFQLEVRLQNVGILCGNYSNREYPFFRLLKIAIQNRSQLRVETIHFHFSSLHSPFHYNHWQLHFHPWWKSCRSIHRRMPLMPSFIANSLWSIISKTEIVSSSL